jgi:hypothetical protein
MFRPRIEPGRWPATVAKSESEFQHPKPCLADVVLLSHGFHNAQPLAQAFQEGMVPLLSKIGPLALGQVLLPKARLRCRVTVAQESRRGDVVKVTMRRLEPGSPTAAGGISPMTRRAV